MRIAASGREAFRVSFGSSKPAGSAAPSAPLPTDTVAPFTAAAGPAPPSPGVNSKGVLQSAAEWTAGVAGALWRFLVVGTKNPEPAPVHEPVRKFAAPDTSGVIVDGERVLHPEFEAQRIHTYSVTDGKQLALLKFEDLLQHGQVQPPPHDFHYVKSRALDQSVEQASQTRSAAVKARKVKQGDRVVPKDATLNPSAFTLYTQADDGVNLGYVNQMAAVGRIEGFHVVAETRKGGSKAVKKQIEADNRANVSVLPLAVDHEIWTEDYGERTLKGGVAVPALLEDADLVSRAVYQDRIRRFYPGVQVQTDDYEGLVEREFPRANFSCQGAVSAGDLQWGMLAVGQSQSVPLRINASHLEGGNVLPGTRADGKGYALVGRDSVAVTRAVLEQDTGKPVSEAAALRAIAADLGVAPADVHPVEQPGQFHLDMRMMLVGPGQVILNDAREAAQVQAQWLKDDLAASQPRHPGKDSSIWQRMNFRRKNFLWNRRMRGLDRACERLRLEGEQRAFYEDLTLKDLQAAGMTVMRMAGVFVDPDDPTRDVFNFLNCRQGVNEQGQRFFVGLGGDSRSEVYVARKLMQDLPTGFARAHFLDRELTPQTLELFGGIKCRTKPEGKLVAKSELSNPEPSTLRPLTPTPTTRRSPDRPPAP